jgi:hypothetical protein
MTKMSCALLLTTTDPLNTGLHAYWLIDCLKEKVITVAEPPCTVFNQSSQTKINAVFSELN